MARCPAMASTKIHNKIQLAKFFCYFLFFSLAGLACGLSLTTLVS